MKIEHDHCPFDCEHPQPVKGDDGKSYCGRCWFVLGVITEMVPCTPDICHDHNPGRKMGHVGPPPASDKMAEIRVMISWALARAGDFVWWASRWVWFYDVLMAASDLLQGADPRGPWKGARER